MQIRISELRQIINEELEKQSSDVMTKHNRDKLKSAIRSAITVAWNYYENVKFNNRDDGVTINDLTRVTKELEAPAKWLRGKGSPEAKPLLEMVDLLNEMGKSIDPFKRLFGRKDKEAKRLEPIVKKLHQIASDNWNVVMYSQDYQNFDDDLSQQPYTFAPDSKR